MVFFGPCDVYLCFIAKANDMFFKFYEELVVGSVLCDAKPYLMSQYHLDISMI